MKKYRVYWIFWLATLHSDFLTLEEAMAEMKIQNELGNKAWIENVSGEPVQ